MAARMGNKPQPRHRHWNLKTDPAEDIFADQLTMITKLWLQMHNQGPSRTLNPGLGLSMGPEEVKWDPSIKAGFKLELQAGTMLPFGLEVTLNAYWKFIYFGYDLGRDHAPRLESELPITARRYLDTDGSTAIVWANTDDVKEMNGVKFHGLQLHTNGCIRFRRAPRQGPGQQSTSTILEASLESIPVFHETVADRAQQAQVFVAENGKAFTKIDKLFCQRMGAMLVEEDWKATFGREAMIDA
ncbi:unnamed protein product [Phytophthora fragariaefolia]|uniref:Unnamed protein product n=1 Tax=Phytophthora fragariaefolia TaxID=1490495 RepID=A0A9W7CNB6_9STRA|nr:unnamed protein product [Phytophthora fragariaefolia]